MILIQEWLVWLLPKCWSSWVYLCCSHLLHLWLLPAATPKKLRHRLAPAAMNCQTVSFLNHRTTAALGMKTTSYSPLFRCYIFKVHFVLFKVKTLTFSIYIHIQLTDLHISNFTDPKRTEQLWEFCNITLKAVSPQLVIISGNNWYHHQPLLWIS